MNELQVKIKEVTRKMMAMVSELSMHQATAMKLQQEVRHGIRSAALSSILVTTVLCSGELRYLRTAGAVGNKRLNLFLLYR